MPKPGLPHWVFLFQNHDEQLLLALALAAEDRGEAVITAGQLLEWFEDCAAHPNLDHVWDLHAVQAALRRMRKLRLVHGTQPEGGGAQDWSLRPAGWELLGKRCVNKPDRRRAA